VTACSRTAAVTGASHQRWLGDQFSAMRTPPIEVTSTATHVPMRIWRAQ
jgi:hypothetical protein